MKWMKTLLWIAVLVLVIFFAFQNTDPVTLQFGLYPVEKTPWVVSPPVPLFLVVLCSVALGVLLAGLGDLYRRFQLKRALRQNQKMIEQLEKEVHSLRGPALDASILPKREI